MIASGFPRAPGAAGPRWYANRRDGPGLRVASRWPRGPAPPVEERPRAAPTGGRPRTRIGAGSDRSPCGRPGALVFLSHDPSLPPLGAFAMPVTNSSSGTNVAEIADGVFRINT